ncbi:hypothetical protein [Methylocella silvestris]|uniref:hypothetical protein n=1 Tax=Methylocella silvestris TaxID=199596 RepID=UPI001AEC05E9|nr:hypothetical protein [Methylocella silvestris]
MTFDPASALAKINALPFVDGNGGRYLVDDDGNAICAFSGGTGALPSMRFCQIRRTGLPQLEQAGSVSDLNIADNAGLLEPVHIVFFADNIVGADFNFYGPRLSRLGHYLRIKSENIVPLATFYPLLRNDVAEQLNHFTELRLFDLKVKATYVQAMREADASLGAAFAANARVLDGDCDEIQLILKPSKETRRSALQGFRRFAGALVHGAHFRENTERFQIKGKNVDTNKVDVIDLLRDQLIAHKQVLRLGKKSRAVDAESAFSAILEAHDELGAELRQAAGIG